MQAYAGQAKESNTATGESESDPSTQVTDPQYNFNPENILTPDLFLHFHTGRFDQHDGSKSPNIGSASNICPLALHVTSCTAPHIEHNPTNHNLNIDSVHKVQQLPCHLPFGCHQIALIYSWH